MGIFPVLWVFVPMLVLWLGVLIFVSFRYSNSETSIVNYLSLIIFTALCFSILISLLELEYIKYFSILLAGLSIWFIFMQFLETKEAVLSYEQKPYRRILMILWVFNNYIVITFGFALSIFFPLIPFWLISLFVGIIVGYISMIVWQMYFAVPLRNLLLRAIVIALVVWEVMWVMHLLPLGYLSLGALVIWLWYLLQLFIRFNFGKKNIIWKKQISFLLTNLVLYFLVLYFFVRWI